MIQKLLPFLTLIALFAGLSIASPSFLTTSNLSSVIRQTAVIDIMALGMTVIIIAGGIDLSVGSVMALAGLLGCMVVNREVSIPLGMFAGILAGLACGFINGLATTQLRINPFIVTLGTLGIFRGVALILSNGLPVNVSVPSFQYVAQGNLLGIPFVLWILLICAAAIHVLLEHTRLGRHAFAIGSNPEAALYAGINVSRVTTAAYMIGGAMTGLAGMIGASRLMAGQPTAGQGYELQAIAAVVIGGGSLRGGEGSVVGTLVGAFIMGLLSNGSDLLGISPYVQQAIIGAIIVFAVWVDELRKRRVA